MATAGSRSRPSAPPRAVSKKKTKFISGDEWAEALGWSGIGSQGFVGPSGVAAAATGVCEIVGSSDRVAVRDTKAKSGGPSV